MHQEQGPTYLAALNIILATTYHILLANEISVATVYLAHSQLGQLGSSSLDLSGLLHMLDPVLSEFLRNFTF